METRHVARTRRSQARRVQPGPCRPTPTCSGQKRTDSRAHPQQQANPGPPSTRATFLSRSPRYQQAQAWACPMLTTCALLRPTPRPRGQPTRMAVGSAPFCIGGRQSAAPETAHEEREAALRRTPRGTRCCLQIPGGHRAAPLLNPGPRGESGSSRGAGMRSACGPRLCAHSTGHPQEDQHPTRPRGMAPHPRCPGSSQPSQAACSPHPRPET